LETKVSLDDWKKNGWLKEHVSSVMMV